MAARKPSTARQVLVGASLLGDASSVGASDAAPSLSGVRVVVLEFLSVAVHCSAALHIPSNGPALVAARQHD